MKFEEIISIEKHFNVNISGMSIKKYSFERQNNSLITEEIINFGHRLNVLQNKTNLSDADFSKILNLEKEEYLEFKTGDRKPNLKVLNAIKQNFEVSIDWLLYCE